jgi:hypothetical protein
MKRMFVLAISALAWITLNPPAAAGKPKKVPPRGLIESMQAMPCGVKEKGLNGLGAVWGSVGVTSVQSNEKLCPQYLFRTDQLEYRIRPTDGKHPVILPIGSEAEFKIQKDKMFLKLADGDKKTRTYQVVAMEPVKSTNEAGNVGGGAAYNPLTRPETTMPATNSAVASPPVERPPQ